ncbi:MAG: hypothetical protein IPL87_00170 [Candidatus Moraniibacteriota bacterium]|nr:MAG: hypothetical protein IPL87_00170 [Candidatus Moranbacteria bacterium]
MKAVLWFSRLLVLLLIVLCQQEIAVAQGADRCSAIANKSTVFYVNGMYVDAFSAEMTKQRLKATYLSYLETIPDQQFVTDEMRCVEFRVAHNQREKAWLDLLEAFVQSSSDDTVHFWEWISRSHGIPVPEWFKEVELTVSKTISSAIFYIVDGDLRQHVETYAGTNGRGIVVPHSQGNFYATQANLLLPRELRLPVLAIATPESVAPSLGYVTGENDMVINTIRDVTGALPANANVPCSPDDWTCHGMSETYLGGRGMDIAWKIHGALFPPVPY